MPDADSLYPSLTTQTVIAQDMPIGMFAVFMASVGL